MSSSPDDLDLNTSDQSSFAEAGWADGYQCWQGMIQSKCRISLQTLGLNTACSTLQDAGSCRDTQIENLQIRLTALLCPALL